MVKLMHPCVSNFNLLFDKIYHIKKLTIFRHSLERFNNNMLLKDLTEVIKRKPLICKFAITKIHTCTYLQKSLKIEF